MKVKEFKEKIEKLMESRNIDPNEVEVFFELYESNTDMLLDHGNGPLKGVEISQNDGDIYLIERNEITLLPNKTLKFLLSFLEEISDFGHFDVNVVGGDFIGGLVFENILDIYFGTDSETGNECLVIEARRGNESLGIEGRA